MGFGMRGDRDLLDTLDKGFVIGFNFDASLSSVHILFIIISAPRDK